MDRDEQRRLVREAACTNAPDTPAVVAPSVRPAADCDVLVPQVETFSAPTPNALQKLVYDLGGLPVLSPEDIVYCDGASTLQDCSTSSVIVPILDGTVSWRDIPLITDSQLSFIAGLDTDVRNAFGITILVNSELTVEYSVSWCSTTLNLSQEQAVWLRDAVVEEATALFEQSTALALSQLDCGYCNDEQVIWCEDIDNNQNGRSVTVPVGEVFSYISKIDANTIAQELGLADLLPCEFESGTVTASCSELADDPTAWPDGASTDSSQTVNGKTITVLYDTFTENLASPITRITTVSIDAGAFLSTDSVASATLLAKEYALSQLVCFLTSEAYANCPPGALGSEADPVNSLPGNFVHIPFGMSVMTDLSSSSAQYDAQVLADELATSLLHCEWGNALQEVVCSEDTTVLLPDGTVVTPSLSGISHAGITEALELIIVLEDIPDGADPQTYVDEQAMTLAVSRLYCVWCNADIPGYCLPTTIGDEIPVIPLTKDSPEYGPQPEGAVVNPLNPYYWSKDATVGVSAGIFCEEDPAVAQAAANALGIQPFVADVDFADSQTCSYSNSPMRVTCLESFKALGKDKAEMLYNWDAAVQLPADLVTVTKGDYSGLEKPPGWSDAKWEELADSDQLWKELVNEMAVMQAQTYLDCKWANVEMLVYCGTTDLIDPVFYTADDVTGDPVYRNQDEIFRFGDAGLHGSLMQDGPHSGGAWIYDLPFASTAGSEALQDLTEQNWPFTSIDQSEDPLSTGPFGMQMLHIPENYIDVVHSKSIGSLGTPVNVPKWSMFSYESPMDADKQALQNGMSRLDCFVMNTEMTAACPGTCVDKTVTPEDTVENLWQEGAIVGAVTNADTIESRSSQFEADAAAKMEAQSMLDCRAWNQQKTSECLPSEITIQAIVVKERTIGAATTCDANAMAQALADSLKQCADPEQRELYGHAWMADYSSGSGTGGGLCPKVQILPKDSILYDFDAKTKLFELIKTLADDTSHMTCGKIKFILHVDINANTKEFVQAMVYVHEYNDDADEDPPAPYKDLFGPSDGPQSYFNVELATAKGGDKGTPVLGPTGKPMLMLTQKVVAPLYMTEVVVKGLTYLTAQESPGVRPSIVSGASFGTRCIFPWGVNPNSGVETYLLRINYGHVCENLFHNNGVANNTPASTPTNAVTRYRPVCPVAEDPYATPRCMADDHWDVFMSDEGRAFANPELSPDNYLKLIIYVNKEGHIMAPGPSADFDTVGLPTEYAVYMLITNAEDEADSIHYVPEVKNAVNGEETSNYISEGWIPHGGVYHVTILQMKTTGTMPEGSVDVTDWVTSDVYTHPFHQSDVDWGADLPRIINRLDEVVPTASTEYFPRGTRSLPLALQFSPKTRAYEFRSIGGRDNSHYTTSTGGGFSDTEDVKQQINVINPSATSIRVIGNGKCGNIVFYDSSSTSFSLAWEDGLITTSGSKTFTDT